MNQTREAALRFRQVLDLGRGRGAQRVSAEQRSRLRELQSEALEYLIQVFTEDETNTAQDLFTFLQEIGGERYADRVLVRLAARFYEQDRWQHGIEAFNLILERMPADERAPRWQLQIARGRASLGEPAEAVEALRTLAANYTGESDWVGQQSDPELVRETEEMVERALRVRAMRWHDLAQRENQNALFERAQGLYGIYLEHFPESEASYNLRFYRAEILFHRLERFDEAGQSYLAAAQQDPQGQYTRDALYNAIGAFEHVREAQLERCTEHRASGGGSRPTPASSDDDDDDGEGAEEGENGEDGVEGEGEEEAELAPPSEEDVFGPSEDPCGETENDRRFSTAIELYVELFPDDPDLPEILFRQGRLYYDRQIYDPAVRLFGQLLERFPNSPYAVTAGELILESFNRARDYQNIESWARRLKDSPAFATEESQRRLDTLILQAVFATGEQLAERGEHADAAEAYMRAAREFPRDERAPQAYFNAGVEYQASGNVAGAAGAYDQLVEHHPGTEIGSNGAWAGAQMYESIAQFSDAARFYESYGEHFPNTERAADALYNATLLRMTAHENDAAVRNGNRFLERFARHESAEEVTFLIGRAQEQAESWNEAADTYRRFIRRTRNASRQVEANTRMAQVLQRAGNTRGANNALTAAVRLARRRRNQLNDQGLYYAAQARYMQAEAILREYEEIQIAGSMDGLRQRLERKSELLRRAAEAFADVVQFQVAEWVTAALFQIGRSYELYAEGLRNAPTPEGLSEEEEQAYFDQLQGFVIPIEERALEATRAATAPRSSCASSTPGRRASARASSGSTTCSTPRSARWAATSPTARASRCRSPSTGSAAGPRPARRKRRTMRRTRNERAPRMPRRSPRADRRRRLRRRLARHDGAGAPARRSAGGARVPGRRAPHGPRRPRAHAPRHRTLRGRARDRRERLGGALQHRRHPPAAGRAPRGRRALRGGPADPARRGRGARGARGGALRARRSRSGRVAPERLHRLAPGQHPRAPRALRGRAAARQPRLGALARPRGADPAAAQRVARSPRSDASTAAREQYDVAELVFRKAMDIDAENSAELQNEMGLLAARAGRHPGGVRASSRQAIAVRSPASPNAHLNQGSVLLHAGDFEGAEAEYRAVLAAERGSTSTPASRSARPSEGAGRTPRRAARSTRPSSNKTRIIPAALFNLGVLFAEFLDRRPRGARAVRAVPPCGTLYVGNIATMAEQYMQDIPAPAAAKEAASREDPSSISPAPTQPARARRPRSSPICGVLRPRRSAGHRISDRAGARDEASGWWPRPRRTIRSRWIRTSTATSEAKAARR